MSVLQIALIVLLAGLLLAVFSLKNSPELRRKLSILLSVAALAVVVYQAIQDPGVSEPVPGQETFDQHWATGWKLGQFLTQDLPEGGTVLVLQANSDAPAQERLSAAQVEGLRSGLLGIGFDLVIRTAEAQTDENLPARSTHVLPAAFVNASVAKYTNANAVVGFGQIPLGELATDNLPPLYVTDPFGSGYWKEWVDQGTIRAAISPRTDGGAPDMSTLAQDPGSIFDATFIAARPAPTP